MVKKFRSFKLNDVASYFLGIGKIPRYSTWEMFKNDPEFLKEYNIRDVQLLDQLEEKTGIVDLSIIKAHICGARLNEKTSGRVLDQFIIRAANKRGVHYKSVLRNVVDEAESFNNSYAGGHVFTPALGRHTNIHTFDYSSLYPSIIRTFNVSPETFHGKWDSGLLEEEGDGPFTRVTEGKSLGGDIGTPTNVRYAGERGVIPSLIHELVVIRNKMRKEEMPKLDPSSFEYKNLDKKQYVYKVLANSMYGIIGAPFFRYYHFDMAESITRTGHFLIKHASEWFNERGYPTIYGDTDSIFVQIADGTDPQSLADELQKAQAELLKEVFQVRESFMVMDYEKSFKSFLITGKKKYVGELTEEMGSKFIMTGMEAKKRDTIKIAAEAQLHLFDMIIKNDTPLESIQSWVENLKKRIMEADVAAEDITVHKKMTMYPKQYKAYEKGGKLPIHVQVYLDAKDKVDGGISINQYIPYIVTETGPLGGIHAELWDGKTYDKMYYWNKQVYPLLERVLEVAFPDVDWTQYHELNERQMKKKLRDADKLANPEKYAKKKRKTKVVETKPSKTRKALF